MPIPQNITAQHINSAFQYILQNGVPDNHAAFVYFVAYRNILFPVKYVISVANRFANGEELDYSPNNFQSQSASTYLRNLGFVIYIFDLRPES